MRSGANTKDSIWVHSSLFACFFQWFHLFVYFQRSGGHFFIFIFYLGFFCLFLCRYLFIYCLLFKTKLTSIFAKRKKLKWRQESENKAEWGRKGAGGTVNLQPFIQFLSKKELSLLQCLQTEMHSIIPLWNSNKSRCVMAFSTKSDCTSNMTFP